MERVFIYTLVDPRTNQVRYVGKTIDLVMRMRKHLTENNQTFKCQWIKGLKAKSLKPVNEVIDECTTDTWEAKERFYIRLYRSMGARLVNTMPGGEGGATMLGRKLTPEQCLKISLAKRGRPRPDLGRYARERNSIKVNQYTLNGEFVAEHPSIKAASEAIGRNFRRIQMMLNGKGKTVNHVGGFVFKDARLDNQTIPNGR